MMKRKETGQHDDDRTNERKEAGEGRGPMMTKKDYITIGLSGVNLVIASTVLLYGNNLIGRLEKKVDALSITVDKMVAEPSRAPVTEHAPAVSRLDQELRKMNLKLADADSQAPQVESWLGDSDSGYPALLASLKMIIGRKRLRGNAVPLTIINKHNLRVHGRQTNQPIETPEQIAPDKLKTALYQAWKEKNNGSTLKDFSQILE